MTQCLHQIRLFSSCERDHASAFAEQCCNAEALAPLFVASILTCRADKKAVRKAISPEVDPDLFWGFRGAGGALGVAISYTTHAFAIPDNVRFTAPTCSAALYGNAVAIHRNFVAMLPPSRVVPGACSLCILNGH